MLGGVKSIAFAALIALGAVGASSSDVSAITVPVQQRSAEAGLNNRDGNIQPVVERRREHRRLRYWRNRQERFRHVREGYNPRYWRRPDRYWRYRHDRYRHWPRYNYWPYRTHFYYDYDPFWDVDPWYDDPPITVAPRVSYRNSAHVEWCLAHYRSYNPRTNTWVGYSGKVYQCDSPYDRR